MFDAKGTDKLNWFAKSKLTGTLPWNDIGKETTNFFSIKGDSVHNRRFFINRSYGGCPNDMGWMVVSTAVCEWEKAFGEYVILYSNKDTYVPWQQELGELIGSSSCKVSERVILKSVTHIVFFFFSFKKWLALQSVYTFKFR